MGTKKRSALVGSLVRTALCSSASWKNTSVPYWSVEQRLYWRDKSRLNLDGRSYT